MEVPRTFRDAKPASPSLLLGNRSKYIAPLFESNTPDIAPTRQTGRGKERMSSYGILHQQRFRQLVDDICEELLLRFVVTSTVEAAAFASSPRRRRTQTAVVSSISHSLSPSSSFSSPISPLSQYPSARSRREPGGILTSPTTSTPPTPTPTPTPIAVTSGKMSHASLVRSSASTPSFRSRDGTLPPHLRDNSGNVRVVVRVRGFLPRGMWCLLCTDYTVLLYTSPVPSEIELPF